MTNSNTAQLEDGINEFVEYSKELQDGSVTVCVSPESFNNVIEAARAYLAQQQAATEDLVVKVFKTENGYEIRNDSELEIKVMPRDAIYVTLPPISSQTPAPVTCDNAGVIQQAADKIIQWVSDGHILGGNYQAMALIERVIQLTATRAVPDGYAVVPIEPSEQQLFKGFKFSHGTTVENIRAIYAAMLNAAPQPTNTKEAG